MFLTEEVIHTEIVVQRSYISFHPESDLVNSITSVMKFVVQNNRSLKEEERP